MSAPGKGRRWLLGCLGGCGLVAILLIGSCVAVTVWVNSPGEVLEPQAIFDPQASGYVEWQLSLDDPGTEAIVEAFTRLTDREEDLPESRIVRTMFRLNQRRQERELRRLFPASAAWMTYAAEAEGEPPGNLFTFSVARLVNQSRVADWVFARVARFADDLPTLRYNGELILAIEEGDTRVYAFLHPLGVFWSNRLEVAQRTIDALQGARTEGPQTLIERELGGLTGPGAIRGVVLNDDGQIARRLQSLLDEPLDEEMVRLLEEVDFLTLEGGPAAGGNIELAMELSADPTLLPVAERAVEGLMSELTDLGLEVRSETRAFARGITVDVVVVDLPGTLDRIGGEIGRELEAAVEEAAQEAAEGAAK